MAHKTASHECRVRTVQRPAGGSVEARRRAVPRAPRAAAPPATTRWHGAAALLSAHGYVTYPTILSCSLFICRPQKVKALIYFIIRYLWNNYCIFYLLFWGQIVINLFATLGMILCLISRYVCDVGYIRLRCLIAYYYWLTVTGTRSHNGELALPISRVHLHLQTLWRTLW